MPRMPLRNLKLVLLLLALGVAVFTTIAAVLGPVSAEGASTALGSLPLGWLLLGIGLLTGLSGLGMYVALIRPALLRRLVPVRDAARAEVRAGQVPAPLVQATILGAALAEGPGLLGAVGYLITGWLPLLALPLAAILEIVLSLPSEEGLLEAIDRARE